MIPSKIQELQDRPVIFDYGSIPAFVEAMLTWRKTNEPGYSIRKMVTGLKDCSPSLVTQVMKGNRRLTRDRVPVIAKVLGLSRRETLYLDRWVAAYRSPSQDMKSARTCTGRRRTAQNHILSDWLNVYVKDACDLKGFKPDKEVLHRLLGGMAPPERMGKSLEFLLKNGFLRKTLDGRVVKNEELVTTSDDIPNEKIKRFHRKAFDLAKQALDTYSVDQRRANVVVLSVNESNLTELKELLKEFYEKLLSFIEDHPDDNERLYQILINLSPVGGGNVDQ